MFFYITMDEFMLKYQSGKSPQFLLRLTALTCPVLPWFDYFVIFLTVYTKTANLANRAKTRQIRAFQEEKLTWLKYYSFATAGRTTTVLCFNYRGKMGQIKAFAVSRYYGWTTTDGSKSSKCSSQKQSSSFIWIPFNDSNCWN